MKCLRIAFVFGLMLMIFAGCEKEEIQPDPLNTDDIALKGKKVKKDRDHFVPFKGTFEVSIDLSTKEGSRENPPVTQEVIGEGNATHLGRTSLVIYQTWWPRQVPPPPPGSDGTGRFEFEAANGDILCADYTDGKTVYVFDSEGKFDHADVTMTCIINKDGSTGRFCNAEGHFNWTGVFYPPPVNKGYATIENGEIKY